MLAPGMFLIGDEDLVAGFEIDAIGDVTVGFGGVAQQGQFFALAADEFRERIAILVPGSVAPDRVILRIGFGEPLGIAVALENRAQHGGRRRADGAIVQVDFVFGNQKQFADFGPVRLFVSVVKRGVGELGWKLCEEIVGDAGNCGKRHSAERGDTRNRGKKRAAIQHETSSQTCADSNPN